MTALNNQYLLACGLLACSILPVHAGTVKIGHISALTGTYAFVGRSVANGVNMAAEELNQSGYFGQDKLEVLEADNGSDRGQAISLFNRMLVRDKVQMVLGPISSAEALAVAPIANKLQAPMMTVALSRDVLAAGPWSFKVTGSSEGPLTTMGRYAVEKMGTKNCFLISIRDNEGYVRQKNAFRDAVMAAGGKILSDETVLSSDSDFTALATKLVNAKPDCTYIDAPPEQGANIIIQAKQAGLPANVKIYSSTTFASPRLIVAGGKQVEGVHFVADFAPGGTSEAGQKFSANYQRKFSTAPDNWAAMGYTMMMVSAKAIKEAGGAAATPAKIKDALAGLKEVPVVIGKGSFSLDADRMPQYGTIIMQVKNGAFVQAN
ncbi:MAG TPA: ABC transporter substrate-binding protein [Ramlibacter sp.]|nr:ABC transporter substrate-binding protein [Ramlibacter sp.]